ncbi:MAG: BlaI/MecI/CopY family transcriptional regulator [Calditrichaeota bacterium]|nr:MAG: BlaI/MecI/CopY family transcriptional regulator [Calditrichota bacterium]
MRTKSTTIRITPAEWEILDTVWKLNSPSVREVVTTRYPNGEKAYTTIQTLMNVLERKGLLVHKKIGLVNFYTPTRERSEIVKHETKNLIRRVFDGSVPALANYLIDQEELNLDDIRKIKKLLDEKESQLLEK